MKRVLVLIAILILVTSCSSARRYLKAHPELSEEQAQAVMEGFVAHGLSKDAVLASLGAPQKTYGYTRDGQPMELWMYSELTWHDFQNVLFESNQVVGWNLPSEVKEKLDDKSATDLTEFLSVKV